jgi:hypothetical protein
MKGCSIGCPPARCAAPTDTARLTLLSRSRSQQAPRDPPQSVCTTHNQASPEHRGALLSQNIRAGGGVLRGHRLPNLTPTVVVVLLHHRGGHLSGGR